MIELNKENFTKEVLESGGVTMVDFWSPKCEPCMALEPEVKALAERFSDKMKFGKLNVLENRRLALSQKVLGLPVIAFYKDGEKISELTGDITPDQVLEAINALVN